MSLQGLRGPWTTQHPGLGVGSGRTQSTGRARLDLGCHRQGCPSHRLPASRDVRLQSSTPKPELGVSPKAQVLHASPIPPSRRTRPCLPPLPASPASHGALAGPSGRRPAAQLRRTRRAGDICTQRLPEAEAEGSGSPEAPVTSFSFLTAKAAASSPPRRPITAFRRHFRPRRQGERRAEETPNRTGRGRCRGRCCLMEPRGS